MGQHGGKRASEEAAGGEDDVGEVFQVAADVVPFQIDVDGLGLQCRWGQYAIPIWGVAVGGIRGGGLRRCGEDGGDGVGLVWGEVEEGEEGGREVLPVVRGVEQEEEEEAAAGGAD